MLKKFFPLLVLGFLLGEWLWGRTIRLSAEPAPAPVPHVPSVEERLVMESTSQGLPPHVAINVAWWESRFQEQVVSNTHDYGIMQLNSYFFPAAPRMTTDENIKAGVELLARYWTQSHSERLTERAYRYGPVALR